MEITSTNTTDKVSGNGEKHLKDGFTDFKNVDGKKRDNPVVMMLVVLLVIVLVCFIGYAAYTLGMHTGRNESSISTTIATTIEDDQIDQSATKRITDTNCSISYEVPNTWVDETDPEASCLKYSSYDYEHDNGKLVWPREVPGVVIWTGEWLYYMVDDMQPEEFKAYYEAANAENPDFLVHYQKYIFSTKVVNDKEFMFITRTDTLDHEVYRSVIYQGSNSKYYEFFWDGQQVEELQDEIDQILESIQIL